MANVTFTNDTTKRTSNLLVADFPENIVLDPQINGRYERDNAEVKAAVEALAADIQVHGQTTPVKFRKNDAGKPVLVFGYSRYHAVNLINKKLRAKGTAEDQLLKLEGTYEVLTEEEALVAAIGENRFRVGTSPMDDCWNITLLVKRFKKSEDEIAQIYFPEAKGGEKKAAAVKWVKDRAALAELHVDAQEAVSKGEIKVTTATKLAKKSKDEQKEIITKNTVVVKGKKRLKVAAVLATGKGKTAEKAKAQVQAAKDKKAGKKPAPAAKSAAVPAPKVTGSVYEAAENMALALDVWRTDATERAEKALIAAHESYRALVPAKSVAA
jgi:ParB-like chromosome segregation protein Spo0J